MRLSDVRDYFALRPFLARPWDFLRLRGRERGVPFHDIALRGGGALRIRGDPMDRHILHRILARDEYLLGGIAAASLDTAIDIGAHIGLFAARAAPLAKRLLCFEPSPDNLPLLRANTVRWPQARVLALAVAGRPGERRLRRGEDRSAHALAEPSAAGAAGLAPVRCVTLEEIFEEHAVERCSLLKLDCEGAEYEILESAPRELLARIDRLRVEYHPVAGEEARPGGARLARLLEAAGHRAEVRASRKEPGRGLVFSTGPRG